MRKSARRKVVVATGAVAALGFAAAIALKAPDEPKLLSLARRVPTDWCNADVEVRSAEEAICIDIPPMVRHGAAPIWEHHTGNARIEQRSLVECPHGTHTEVSTSPDGRLILCLDHGGGNEDGMLRCVRTGKILRLAVMGDVYHYPVDWMPDSRRWLSLGTVPKGFVTVYDAGSPAKPVEFAFPNFKSAVWGTFVARTSSRLVCSQTCKTHRWTILSNLRNTELVRDWYRSEPMSRGRQAVER